MDHKRIGKVLWSALVSFLLRASWFLYLAAGTPAVILIYLDETVSMRAKLTFFVIWLLLSPAVFLAAREDNRRRLNGRARHKRPRHARGRVG